MPYPATIPQALQRVIIQAPPGVSEHDVDEMIRAEWTVAEREAYDQMVAMELEALMSDPVYLAHTLALRLIHHWHNLGWSEDEMMAYIDGWERESGVVG